MPAGLGVLLVTYTSIRQRKPAGIKPPVSEMEVAPVTAVNTADAPQPVAVAGVELLIVKPAGKGSVTEKFVKSVSVGAKISILNLEFSPAAIVEGVNVLIPVTSGPPTVTVTLAFAERRRPTF